MSISDMFSEFLGNLTIGNAETISLRYGEIPSTNYAAYGAAQKALQKLEDMMFSDEKVDAFLPKELKRKVLR